MQVTSSLLRKDQLKTLKMLERRTTMSLEVEKGSNGVKAGCSLTGLPVRIHHIIVILGTLPVTQ